MKTCLTLFHAWSWLIGSGLRASHRRNNIGQVDPVFLLIDDKGRATQVVAQRKVDKQLETG